MDPQARLRISPRRGCAHTETLGGARGLLFYCQRTALQGCKPLLEKLTGAATAFGDA